MSGVALKVVMDVLDVMISHGVSVGAVRLNLRSNGTESSGWGQSVLSRGKIFSRLGAVFLVSVGEFGRSSLWAFLISFIGSLFIAGMRLFVGCGICCVRILWFTPYKWLRPDLVPPAPFL